MSVERKFKFLITNAALSFLTLVSGGQRASAQEYLAQEPPRIQLLADSFCENSPRPTSTFDPEYHIRTVIQIRGELRRSEVFYLVIGAVDSTERVRYGLQRIDDGSILEVNFVSHFDISNNPVYESLNMFPGSRHSVDLLSSQGQLLDSRVAVGPPCPP